MRTLSYGMNVSVDGFIAAPGDDLSWGVPSDEALRLVVGPDRHDWHGPVRASAVADDERALADRRSRP